ncbi:hypothetical protein G7Y89_g10397 [Cudoniella acicularis]|uniref:Uncharacterized protein n=1 Tax=Cudoniella acicularis TaxID=354080 RepID=A0A8H4VZ91_9HELO|nr:hypothetical protein G7Y89_g10397 [Cudoniella acicularis]
MAPIFCCSSGPQPYRPQILMHEQKFKDFINWMPKVDETSTAEKVIPSDDTSAYAIQVVRQVNFGAQESVRYFISTEGDSGEVSFFEITEKDLIEANYEKLNSYKNFKCVAHNKFFELNVYQKNPVNAHHWRANIARPAADIDLPSRQV